MLRAFGEKPQTDFGADQVPLTIFRLSPQPATGIGKAYKRLRKKIVVPVVVIAKVEIQKN
jgi:hypothetical protein